MTVTITCTACGRTLTADTEEELAELGVAHGAEHGHARGKLSIEHALRRIRRHGSSGN
jgi:DNA-binding IclR family transcriptional regulator